MSLNSPFRILASSRFTPVGVNLDQDFVLAQFRFRHFGRPQTLFFSVTINDECFHGFSSFQKLREEPNGWVIRKFGMMIIIFLSEKKTRPWLQPRRSQALQCGAAQRVRQRRIIDGAGQHQGAHHRGHRHQRALMGAGLPQSGN